MKPPREAVLETIRLLLGDQPHLTGEWSFRTMGGEGRVREHALFWVGACGDPGNAEAFGRMGALLEHMGAPAALRTAHAELTRWSLRQGVGVSLDGQPDKAVRLYVQHHPPGEATERYDAFKGCADGRVTHARYEFNHHAGAAHARAMGEGAHPALRPLHARLLEDPRLVRWSGSWVRQRGGVPDQLCLTYPWHPPVHAVVGLAEALGSALPESVQSLHLRHVALAGVAESRPHVTLYFSAPLPSGHWPRSLEELQAIVDASAAGLHASILPILAAREVDGAA